MLDSLSTRFEHYLDLLSQRQKLVAANIANIDTPGYRTKDIDFQYEFMSAVEGSSSHVIEPTDLTVKNDGNNVSLDREARLLAENAIRFNAVSGMLKNELRLVRRAIEEGKTA